MLESTFITLFFYGRFKAKKEKKEYLISCRRYADYSTILKITTPFLLGQGCQYLPGEVI